MWLLVELGLLDMSVVLMLQGFLMYLLQSICMCMFLHLQLNKIGIIYNNIVAV